MSSRWIAIGDVHGCADELEDLLALLSPVEGDRVVLLGDLVNRGPASHRVVQLARREGFLGLMGNHEHRLLAYRREPREDLLKRYDYATLGQLTEEDWAYLGTLRATLEPPGGPFVLVHGGFLPGIPWREQSLEQVCRTKWVHPPGAPEGADPVHWSDLWGGPERVLYGHTPGPEVRVSAHALGLDTACVYGGKLTACLLPGMELVQVPARRSYVA